MTERQSILQLLPSHRRLLSQHRTRLAELVLLAKEAPQRLGAIVCSLASEFGEVAAEGEAGQMFVVRPPGGPNASVIVLTIVGLVAIAASVAPLAVPHIQQRAPQTLAVLLVDDEDELAMALVGHSSLKEPS